MIEMTLYSGDMLNSFEILSGGTEDITDPDVIFLFWKAQIPLIHIVLQTYFPNYIKVVLNYFLFSLLLS